MRLTSLLRSAAVSTKLAKPKMRGLLFDQIKFDIAQGFAVGILCSTIWYFWAMKPRKENYANFYKNYDPDKGRTDEIRLFSYLPTWYLVVVNLCSFDKDFRSSPNWFHYCTG